MDRPKRKPLTEAEKTLEKMERKAEATRLAIAKHKKRRKKQLDAAHDKYLAEQAEKEAQSAEAAQMETEADQDEIFEDVYVKEELLDTEASLPSVPPVTEPFNFIECNDIKPSEAATEGSHPIDKDTPLADDAAPSAPTADVHKVAVRNAASGKPSEKEVSSETPNGSEHAGKTEALPPRTNTALVQLCETDEPDVNKLKNDVADAEDWLAQYRLPAAKDPPGGYGPARFDADGRLEYKRTILLFGESKFVNGRKYYYCIRCIFICRTYGHIPEARLGSRYITVVDGSIFGRDPDLAGTCCGHLCQKPDVVVMIDEKQKLKNDVADAEDWLAQYRLPDAKDPPCDYGPARFDANGRLEYKRTILLFGESNFVNGRKYYYCVRCFRLCQKYGNIPEAGLSSRCITVVDGRIFGRDPDLAGSNCGHICRKPHLVAMVEERQKLRDGVTDTEDWLAPYRLPVENDPPADHGPAQFDTDGHLTFESRLHAGTTLLFTRTKVTANGKTYYGCVRCISICRKYGRIPEARLRTRNFCVINGHIFGRDPDLAGSSCGHLCQKANVVAMIDEKQKLKREEAAKTLTGTDDAFSAGRASTSRRKHESQAAAAPPRKRAKTDSADSHSSKVSSTTTEADDVNVSGAVGNTPAVTVNPAAAPAGDPFEGFQPVFGKAVPVGATTVKFEGVIGSYTFELAKEGSRLVGGVWVPISSFRCAECFKVMERAGRRQDVPFVIVVNGSFVERDPEFPMGKEHFCSSDVY